MWQKKWGNGLVRDEQILFSLGDALVPLDHLRRKRIRKARVGSDSEGVFWGKGPREGWSWGRRRGMGNDAHRALDLEKREANGSLPRLRRLEDEVLERFPDLCVAARVGIREVV